MPSMTLEGLKAVFEIGGVILLFLTFICGAGALYTSSVINRRQSAELRDFQLRIEAEQQKTAAAQEGAAKAQLELNQSLRAFARRSGDRVLNFSAFVESLKGQSAKPVEIWYKPDDTEAERFADDLNRALKDIGWPASVRPVHSNDRLGSISSPAKYRGILVVSRHIQDASPFLMLILKSVLFGGQGAAMEAPELPDDKLWIVVGIRDQL
jgi:hypothetical protein